MDSESSRVVELVKVERQTGTSKKRKEDGVIVTERREGFGI